MRQLLVLVSFVTLAWAAPKPIISPDIIGGEGADPAKNLHAVSIQYNGKHICGGSVLTPATGNAKFVLTAAHCVYGLAASDLSVIVGRQKLSGTGGKVVKVKALKTHDDFDPFDLLNDIAVLTVEEIPAEVTTLTTVETDVAVIDGTKYQLAGWGKTATTGAVSDDLKIIDQTTTSTADCKAHDKQFCAQGATDIGACSGDAGSPLMALPTNNDPMTKQVGILSYGFGCAKNNPDVYTNVNEYNMFIESVVNPTTL